MILNICPDLSMCLKKEWDGVLSIERLASITLKSVIYWMHLGEAGQKTKTFKINPQIIEILQ